MQLPTVFPVTCHTDYVAKGSTFVAIKGQTTEGTKYIEAALQKGATRIVIQKGTQLAEKTQKEINRLGVNVLEVDDARVALATLSAQAAGYPAKQLKLLGITGTKGKTTTAWMLFHLLKQAGHSVALLSTVENYINDYVFKTPLTTPQPDYLHQFFKLCVTAEVEYVVMEVAAQATTFKRIETLQFDGLIFTNLDREHGELYPTMEEYFTAKYALFSYAKKDAPVLINADDVYGKRILAEHPNFIPYKKEGIVPKDSFPGDFNKYNYTAAVSLAQQLGIKISQKNELPLLKGRLEKYVLSNNIQVFIDYAHTPSSFENLFTTVRPWTEQLVVLFGAGGGKDHEKRPLMGKIADQYADVIFITSDNPRHENPQIIANEIVAGVTKKEKVVIELDREVAIQKALAIAQPGAVILLLGKGPDEYQLVGEVKTFFSEKEIITKFHKQQKPNFLSF